MKVTVTSGWLKKQRVSNNLAILDARSRGAFKKSHIKGAVHADLFHYFVPGTDPRELKEFQNDLAHKLGDLGLTGDETVVVYESSFGMRAARVAWMLEYAGTKKVFLLEGGFRAWRKLHYPTEKWQAIPHPRTFRIRPDPKLLATADQIRSKGQPLVLDVRSQSEFNGTEGRDCDSRLGRIPRSRWIEWTTFHNGVRFKTMVELKRTLEQVGIAKNSKIATYCHRGARSASAFYALRSLGFKNVKNYIGSWHEWSSRKDLPVVK